MLKKGDKLRHKRSGVILVVVARLGNGADYRVKVKREDGRKFASTGRDTMIVTEAGWQVTKSGKWEVVASA
jgi:hypothetical protein